MTSGLEGNVVVVTGGSMGIGYACARELLRVGAHVVLCARDEQNLARALSDLRRESKRVDAIPADVAEHQSVERLFEFAGERGAVVGVVHAAGVYGPIAPVTTVDPSEWWDALHTNLYGTFLVAREACRRMKAAGTGGSVVLLAGGGAASPFPNYTSYAAAKAAIVRFAETIAIELADEHIRINALAPGFVATRLHDRTLDVGPSRAGGFFAETKRRLDSDSVPPEVAAKACAFLLSERARGISGKFVAAPFDDWEHWDEHLDELRGSDLFTLRRIVPRDRGANWQ